MNLLTDDWIPVEGKSEIHRISLETLLTTETDWKLCCYRDDMELATIQMLVCIVQVCFMPKDRDALVMRLTKPLSSEEYKKGVEPYLEWFDLAHEKWPFMQSADVVAKDKEKNFTSLQKLFVGLPEKTSKSGSSNAFFNKINEVESAHFGDVAVAIFQQATNGFSLGGKAFSVGLKGGMPITTLILGKTLKESVWLNILTSEYMKNIVLSEQNIVNEPTWVRPISNGELAVNISVIRGLFWQPAKIRLKIVDGIITGFYTEPGLSCVSGFWVHPHTPIDYLRLQKNKPSEKPYQSIKNNASLWSQMLSFFYTSESFSNSEGSSSALVVQQYRDFRLADELHLAVGGYVKGGSAESLGARRHEVFALSKGWESRCSEMIFLVDIGMRFEKALYVAITRCCSIAFPSDKPDAKRKGERPNLKQRIFDGSKKAFLNNSESLFHDVLKKPEWSDVALFVNRLGELTVDIFDEVTQSMIEDVKYYRGVLESRRLLNIKIKEIVNDTKRV